MLQRFPSPHTSKVASKLGTASAKFAADWIALVLYAPPQPAPRHWSASSVEMWRLLKRLVRLVMLNAIRVDEAEDLKGILITSIVLSVWWPAV